MPICETCGNDYDRSFTVTLDGQTHTYDSFECAIHALAPVCPHCGVRVVGHGVQHEGTVLCCKHCADMMGARGITDRIGNTPAETQAQQGPRSSRPRGAIEAAGDDVDRVTAAPGPRDRAMGNAAVEAPAATNAGRGITDRL
jgi:hypothetical protein